jgi:hypothetical protein
MNGAILILPAYAFMEWTREKFSIFLKNNKMHYLHYNKIEQKHTSHQVPTALDMKYVL